MRAPSGACWRPASRADGIAWRWGGAGSIVRWLEQRVGPSGKVVALDTDPRFLRGSGSSTIEILQGDICDTDLPLPRSTWSMLAA